MPDAAEFFNRYHVAVYRYLLRLTGQADLAEDLTQEVFVRIVRSANRYTAQGREEATGDLQFAGPEDVPVAAAFLPLPWTLSGTWTRTSSQAGVQVTVTGTLTGHCRLDGAAITARTRSPPPTVLGRRAITPAAW